MRQNTTALAMDLAAGERRRCSGGQKLRAWGQRHRDQARPEHPL
jgi:hypothetical protein